MNLRFIPTVVHGVGDYLGGALSFLAPELFGFAREGGAAVAIPRVLGASFVLLGLTTRYELGLFKLIPMSRHLQIDYAASLLHMLSPFVFGFSRRRGHVWLPHVVLGGAYLLISIFTRTRPARV